MSLGMTRRSFLTAASAGALAVRGLADPREAPAQPKPAKLSVCQEDFEPISSWVAKRFQAKHGIEVAYTTTEFTANYEKQVADMISGSATSLTTWCSGRIPSPACSRRRATSSRSTPIWPRARC